MKNKIINGDCLELYSSIKQNSIDLVLTDLPYGTTACKWDSILPFDKLWEMVNYVLKPNGRFITTSSQPFTSALIMSNPSFFHHEIIWNKRFAANYAQAKTHPQKIHENIIVFGNKPLYNPQMTLRDKPIKKGKNAGAEMYGGVSGLGRKDYKGKVYTHKYPETIIEYNVRAEKRGLHPTQKPVSLFEYLVLTYSNKFDMVFDPCVGSGTTAIACENLDRDYICFEKDAEICRKANERINAHTKLL